MSQPHDAIDQLRATLRQDREPGRGARLKRALLLLAIPATAGLCTACYAAAMPLDVAEPQPAAIEAPLYPTGIDCDGDGTMDAASAEGCDQAFSTWK